MSRLRLCLRRRFRSRKVPPVRLPQGSKFEVQEEGKMVWADEHRVGVAKDVDPEILEGLRMNFTGECTEVGMYLAMVPVRPSGKATLRSALSTSRLPLRKLSTLPSSQSFLVKWSPTPPRRTWSCG